jgi:4,5-DOPA dioxygenase extradiol
MYPNADVPVLQLSIDFNAPMEKHLEIGRQLFELRKEGVLIIGSGNIVHNLMMYSPGAKAYDWAIDFDGNIKNCLMKNDYDSLMNYKKFNSAQLAHPTNDHYLPLLYAVGASNGAHPIFYNEKISDGSMSMRCIVYNK